MHITQIIKSNVLEKLLSTINNSTFKNILICISNTREWRLALFQALKLFHLIPQIWGDSIIPTLQIGKITQER